MNKKNVCPECKSKNIINLKILMSNEAKFINV